MDHSFIFHHSPSSFLSFTTIIKMAMVDSLGPGSYQFPSRKPLPTSHLPTSDGNIIDMNYTASGRQGVPAPSFSMASLKGTQSSASPILSTFYNNPVNTTRRTPSNATSSTNNTTAVPTRTPSTVSSTLSRTASSRSGASLSPSSYVALMRKQKATVWCDRAQQEDPRILAQLKAAKIRAAREVSGGNTEGRKSSGSMGSGSLGVRSKIRHHGVPKASGYNSPNMVGGGVPMRLSASEVGDDGIVRDDGEGMRNTSHQRADSGRSSIGSNRWLAATSQRQSGRYSQGSLRTSGQGNSPNENIPELEETPVPSDYQKQNGGDYFSRPAGYGGSGSSSSEQEASFGNVGQMHAPPSARDTAKSKEDLKRRGSVDERSNTMGGLGGGRLFVANPDVIR